MADSKKPIQTISEVIGRSSTLTRDGASDSAVRQWTMVRGQTGTASVPSPETIAGLPALGSAHPVHTDLVLSKWTVNEDAASGSIVYQAEYTRPSEDEGEVKEDDEVVEEYRIEARGWRGTSYSAPACYDVVTGSPVVLPTGEPFENVPEAHRSGMTFYITFQTTKNHGIMAANCTVNAAAITIDGQTIPARCGRLSASVEEIVNQESKYKYRVSLEVEVVHNYVKLAPNTEEIDIGHDVALLLQGYKYIGTATDKNGIQHPNQLIPFMEPDGEGGLQPATTPGFLTANGNKVEEPSATNCYYLHVHTIKGAAWDSGWFH